MRLNLRRIIFDIFQEGDDSLRKGQYSPWGKVQTCDTLCPGIYLVTTPSHGGIMVDATAAFFLTSHAQKCGFREGGYLCFEEDCCEQVVLRELMDRGMWSLPDRIKDKAAFEQAINDSIQRHHPDYWKAREAGKTTPRPVQRSRSQKGGPTR